MSFLYGIFEKILVAIYGMTGSFGLSIILLTILIKIVLLPFTLKQDKSMKEMKKLQPKIDELKDKYKNDPQLLNQKTMELYKEHKVNPAGGCLPLIIQLPILWALFGVLRKEGVVPDEAFLWFSLVTPDPFFILPILNGAVSFVQQKLMGTSNNPQMKNMMYIFPIMMIFISYKMPGGLQLYWLTSSVTGVIQQYFVMNRGE
ncbi:membrane protein insertase YidC [Fusobacterium perfoetens]|uniref:YidC/Oxa1 family membrane protein insertase n=1 Tax=Fusobacterium perfoetens TaxID=852 RepID=UPI0015A1F74C|nr:YidC/Oxa1 family membrane protein insertase [Fusobacterium perfoetens]MCF2625685.1 membrane protein insertase YidC [Fusobacterium perfoetens]